MFNFLLPQYSTFEFSGVQRHGKKAAQLQVIYMLIMAAVFLVAVIARASVFVFWLAILPVLVVWDILVGFVRGLRLQ